MKAIRWATMAAGVATLVAAIWYVTLPRQEEADVAASSPAILTAPGDEVTGVCVLASDDGLHAVRGTVHFRPKGGEVEVSGRIEGLTPGRYQFLVTEYGDLRSPERGSIGATFFRMDWPLPTDGTSLADRMSFEVGESGVAVLNHLNPAFTMYGPESIIGRAFVLYRSSTTPSGDQVAAGVIGRKNSGWSPANRSLPANPVTAHSNGVLDNC